jgi:rare lipoprotein A
MRGRHRRFILAGPVWLPVLAVLSGCAVGPAVREMMGPPMSCKDAENYREEGLASWYGSFHQGRPTASGERFDTRKLTAAHRRLPLGSQVKVANPENGREAVFKINDRGPFVIDRIVDVSQSGAQKLGFERDGIAPVKLEVIACGKWVKGAEPEKPQAAAGPASPEAAPAEASTTPEATR